MMKKTSIGLVAACLLAVLTVTPSAQAAGPAAISYDATGAAEFVAVGFNAALETDRLVVFHLDLDGTQQVIFDSQVQPLSLGTGFATDLAIGGLTCVGWESIKDPNGLFVPQMCLPNL